MTSIPLKDYTYHADITILIMPTQEWPEYFKKRFNYDSKDCTGFEGQHFSIEHKQKNVVKHFILLSDWNWTVGQMSLLCHEMNHCCFSVMRDAMIPLSRDTEEPFCYYVSAMLSQAFWKLRKVNPNEEWKKKKRTKLK